jgi:hypothetical protein
MRDEWMGIGLSTARCERGPAERSMAALYAEIDEPPPQFAWFDSPHVAQVAAQVAQQDLAERSAHATSRLPYAANDAALRSRLRCSYRSGFETLQDAVEATLDATARLKLESTVRAALSVTLRESLDATLRERLASERAAPGPALEHSIRATLDSVIEATLASIRPSAAAVLDPIAVSARDGAARLVSVWWEIPAVAYYCAARELGIRFPVAAAGQLGHWIAFARSGALCWRVKGLVVMCERPTAIVVPGNQMSRAGDRCALEWSDGWSA